MDMNKKLLTDQIKKFPKTDLHRHLEGSILPETFIEIARTYGGTLPACEVEALRPMIQVVNDPPGFHNFLNKFKVFRCFYPCLEAVEEIAFRAVRDAADDGVKYLELRYSPTHFACNERFSERDVVRCISAALGRASKAFDIIVTPILTISRDYGVALAEQTVAMLAALPPGSFYGLDLAGDEVNNNAQPYAKLFAMARQAGLGLTIHAGEAGGAANVRQAVEEFHADRIGHGIRSMDDADVMKLLRDNDILLEVSLTSNCQTGVVSSIREHPLRQLMRQGVPLTINTDDPAISGITLTDEYVMAIRELGITLEDLKALNISALDHAFYPDKQELKKKLSRLWD
jgi:adenosine deaminase